MKKIYKTTLIALSLGLLLPSISQANDNSNVCNPLRELLAAQCNTSANAAPVRIEGILYNDKNYNLQYDVGEEVTNSSEFSITLVDSKGVVQTVTKSRGSYTFINVNPGKATITITGDDADDVLVLPTKSLDVYITEGQINTIDPISYFISFV